MFFLFCFVFFNFYTDTPALKYKPGKKQSSPSGSSGVDSAVDSVSVHSSDEMTTRELLH